MGLKDLLVSRFRAFRANERGNVLVMTGFALIPMIGVTGAVIDYGRATTARQTLNAALDSAALMAARDASKLTDSELRRRIDAWITANLHGDSAKGFTGATIVIDRAARTISVQAELDVVTTLTRVIGKDTITISSKSQSTWGTNTIELALALDNTGSMASSGKMDALKAASLDLIQIMRDATDEPDQIKISIVPFSTRVLIDTRLKNEPWLRWDMSRSTTTTTCTGMGWFRTCTPTTTRQTISKSTWEGCVADRDKSYDVQDGDGGNASGSAYPADFCDQYSPATQAKILPLTSNWTDLTSRITAMTPVGSTNVTIGAVWGMATLSQGAPFTEAKPVTTPRLKKFMILLTDGDNTRNRFDGNGSNTEPLVDERTKLACANAKAAGINVYTIRVMDGNRDLLKDCASSVSQYYEVNNASQLSPVFKQIAREISQVRLTQ